MAYESVTGGGTILNTPGYKNRLLPAMELILEAYPGERLHAAQWHERIILSGMLTPEEIERSAITVGQVRRTLEMWNERGLVKTELVKRTRYYWQEAEEKDAAA